MGQVTRVAITGANGFVGRACVAEARARGINVVAVYRSSPLPEWSGDDDIQAIRMDLADKDRTQDLATALAPCSAVIHAAAHLGDNPEALLRDTAAATETVLAARPEGCRIVLVSSLSVYDMTQVSRGDAITEQSPIEAAGTARDAYARSKLDQEAMVRADPKQNAWILRHGAIWGAGRSWHALMGFWASRVHVTIGSEGALPLTHVKHTAWCLVQAALTPPDGIVTLNVFDDDLPTRTQFERAHKAAYGWPRLSVTVPYGLWLGLVRVLKPVSARLPGLFREPVLRARMMPLRFPNTALRDTLGYQDTEGFEALMQRTKEAE